MRFEKLLYEKVVNTRMLNRQRVMGNPKKWFNENRTEAHRIVAHKFFNQGITGAIFRPLEGIMSWLFYQWPRDIAVRRGLILEDFWVHNERDQRRDYFTETVWKQSCHPYQPLFYRRRRGRYYKIERAVRGFQVPEYLKVESSKRTLAETIEVKEEWENFTLTNYYSDMTPTTRGPATSRMIALEVINTYGLFQEGAWERYFFNEASYGDTYTEEELKEAANPYSQFDLNNEEGRRQFEVRVNKFIQLHPGSIVPEGEAFNFKEFYAKWAIANGKDTSRFDPKLIEELKAKLSPGTQDASSRYLPVEDKKPRNAFVGKAFPKALRGMVTRGIMPKNVTDLQHKI